MTRIGFAYNQKPESTVGPVSATISESRPDEEPPSSSDVYAEWDSAETIAAVATALSAFGDVIPLEATEEFPERLRAARPDIVFNIAEGLHGSNREAHVPAICEFLDVPYSGSDPYTLSLCLHKARTKDVLTARGIPNASFFLIESEAELETLVRETRTFPLFLKPVQEGSSKGITERNFVRTRDDPPAQLAHGERVRINIHDAKAECASSNKHSRSSSRRSRSTPGPPTRRRSSMSRRMA